MAFKNLVQPNVALCGDFLNSTAGFGAETGMVISYDTETKYSGKGSIKIENAGYGLGTRISNNFTVLGGESRSLQARIKGTPGKQLYIQFARAGEQFAQIFTADGTFQRITVSGTATTGTNQLYYLYVRGYQANAGPVWIDEIQFEQGLTPTDWEFPGIDLNNQQLQGAGDINPVTLQNILELNPLEAEASINPLTVQSIIEMAGLEAAVEINPMTLQSLLKTSCTIKQPQSVKVKHKIT
jgi:hypothetical protein